VCSVALDGASGWSGDLPRGLYLAEVPDSGLRQGFQVSGGGAVEVTVERAGPPVLPPAAMPEPFALDVVATNPAASITVTGPDFERTFTATGQLHEHDEPGVYKVRVQFGRDIGMLRERSCCWTGTPASTSPRPRRWPHRRRCRVP